MAFKHIYSPYKGMILNAPTTLIPPEASPYIKGMYIKDGEIVSDFGMSNFPSPGDAKTNRVHGTVMMIDQFYELSGLSYLLALTTTNIYEYNTSTETWDCITQGTTVEDCEDAWTANTNVTSSAEGTIKLRGSNSVKIDIADAFGTGVAAYEDISSKDISSYTALHFWIRSSVATDAGDLKIRVSEETAGGTGATYEDLDVPALTADTWTPCCVDFSTPANLNAVLSVALVINKDLGAQTVYIDDLRAVKRFTGDEDNRFSCATMNDTFIITNGIDQPQKVTASAGSLTVADLSTNLASGTISTSEVAFAFKDHLFLMNNTENGADCPQRVSWTNIGQTEDWTGGTAGYQDLVDDESWVVGAELLSDNAVIIYKERSIVLMYWVGGHTPFRFRTMVHGTGILTKECVVNVGGEHFCLGPDTFYAYNGGQEIDVLDDVVKKTMYGRMDQSYVGRAFLLYAEEDDEIQIWLPVETAYVDEGWCMDTVHEVWYRKTRTISGFGFYKEQSALTIGDLSGTIGEQNWRFGDALTKAYSPITLVGDHNGKIYKLNKLTLDNNGTAITNEFQTPDFVLPDTPEHMNKSMRVRQLLFEAKGQSVTTEWSEDEGNSWNPTATAGNNTTSLDSNYGIYQQDFDAVVKKIRFRFKNSSSSSGFTLRYYGFDWIVRSGRG